MDVCSFPPLPPPSALYFETPPDPHPQPQSRKIPPPFRFPFSVLPVISACFLMDPSSGICGFPGLLSCFFFDLFFFQPPPNFGGFTLSLSPFLRPSLRECWIPFFFCAAFPSFPSPTKFLAIFCIFFHYLGFSPVFEETPFLSETSASPFLFPFFLLCFKAFESSALMYSNRVFLMLLFGVPYPQSSPLLE